MRRWQLAAVTFGEHVAEVLGTFIIILFGDGVGRDGGRRAQPVRPRRGDLRPASGDWLLIAFGWGFAVCFAVYVAGGVTGAHLNPAVTIAMALRRGFPWAKVPGYMRRAGARRVRRRGARLPQLPLRDRRLRGREGDRPADRRTACPRSASSPPPRRRTSSPGRAARWTRSSAPRFLVGVHLRASRTSTTRRCKAQPRAAGRRVRRRRDRHLLRRQRGLRDQPGARPRAAAVRLARGLGARSRCPATTATSTPTSGCRSSGRWSARGIGACVYDVLIRNVLIARGRAGPGHVGSGHDRDRGGAHG